MPVHNADIARTFEEIADLLEIDDANPFRVRAYRNAARVLGELQLDIAKTIERGAELPKLPGNPLVSILAHPLGRLIDTREPYDVDMLKVIRKAAARGRFLELNAHPERLDLLDSHCRMAKDEGVLVSINSDAHGALEFDNLKFGIGQARRGWLEKGDVLNARPLAELKRLLASGRPRADGAAAT